MSANKGRRIRLFLFWISWVGAPQFSLHQQCLDCLLQNWPRCGCNAFANHKNHIPSRYNMLIGQPNRLTYPSLEPVTLNRIPLRLAYHKPTARLGGAVRQRAKNKQWMGPRTTAFAHAAEIPCRPKALWSLHCLTVAPGRWTALIADSQAPPAFFAPGFQHVATSPGAHSFEKSMDIAAFTPFGLPCSLWHCFPPGTYDIKARLRALCFVLLQAKRAARRKRTRRYGPIILVCLILCQMLAPILGV